MIKEFWQRLTRKRQSNTKLTRKEQILAELDRGAGTAKQLAGPHGIEADDCSHELIGFAQAGFDQGHGSGRRGRGRLGGC